ncbi:signal peptide [Acinetobacter junii]|uniref:hypothetical protein n=1 Tax=Acinetobacter junii TaxID=40215 RepID=UPI0002CF5720|nr:hypothetical protein [Acinetobacter junii]ENV67305.1 hypothetical protein F948_00828 [Acinetobacter junii CIP 64.5]SUU19046.1 signal peptide [Acinetobacter junii]SUU21501.1 signal peptide [Acinetobacter junii]
MKKIIPLLLLCTTNLSHAELQALDNQTLQSIQGQGGADLSFKLSLNHNILSDTDLLAGTTPTFNCDSARLEYCRLAISVNKRFVQQGTAGANDPVWSMAASDPSIDNKGRKLWVVFKGLQGTLNIQKLGLDAVDLQYLPKTGTGTVIKPAMQFTFDSSKPIQIRNFGFNALSIEQDTGTVLSYYDTNGNLIEGTTTNPQDYGFLKTGIYSSVPQSTGATGTTANNYDVGREKGFLGLQMNGNLAIDGKVQIFACSNHARC